VRCKLSLCVKDTCSCLCMRRMLSLCVNVTWSCLCMRRIISLCVKDTLLSIRYGYVYETHMISIRCVYVYEMIKEVLCRRYKTFKCE
jgi:hypothetical protein